MPRRRPYRLLEHTADIRAKVTGRTKRRLFQNAVFTLSDLIVEAPTIRSRSSRTIRVSASSEDLLLVRLLQEVLFLFDAKRFLSRRLEFVSWKLGRLLVRSWGERLDLKRHRPKTEIKAVTLHGLAIRKRGGYFEADLVFDV